MLSTLLLAFAVLQAPQPQAASTTSTTTTVSMVVIPHTDSPSQLSLDELQIKEDGRPVDGPSMKKRNEEDAFLWVILLDASGSQRAEFEQKRNAAIHITETIARPQDKVIAVVYTDTDHVEVNGKDGSRSEAIELFKTSSPRGTTALFDALVAVADFSRRFGLPPGSSALLHFGDGEDNASAKGLDDAITKLQECDVPFFPVFLNRSNTSARGTNDLAKLAKETGGVMLSFDKNRAAEAVVKRWEPYLRQRLLISYAVSPPRQTSKRKVVKHTLEIESMRNDWELLYRKKRIESNAK